MDEKTCSRCREVKTLDQFYRKAGRPTSWCKQCTLADMATRYRAKHPEPPPYVPPTEKACRRCGETKPIEQFHRMKSARDGRQVICRACSIALAKKWNQDHPEYHRQKAREYAERHPDRKADITLRWRLGVPWGTYARMFAEQNGKCAICGTDSPGARLKRFPVDHDKETGQVRGLLCGNCNVGIGNLRHSEPILLSAISYLKRFK